MKLLKNIGLASGLCSVLALGACDATVGGTGDASGDDASADAVSSADTGAKADTGTAADTATGGKKYTWLIIDGSPATEPDCSATNSPGPDIDAVALFSKEGKLKGVGKPGTAKFKAGAKQLCAAQNKKTDVTQVCGPVNGHVYVATKKTDTEYFGLSDGTVEVQFGACSTATEDLTKCDGAGAVQEIANGDQIAVYEVDGTYLSEAKCKAASSESVKDAGQCGKGPQAGLAEDGCKCLAEQYQVWIGSEEGKAEVDLKTQTGTNQYIDVKLQ